MKLWNERQLSEALKQEIHFQFEASSVTTDTRNIKVGEIFVALKGENFDGNKFCVDAIKKGAVAVICDDAEIAKTNNKIILVENSLKALFKIAKTRRKTAKAKIIAITGSVGKTTTKELTRDILLQKYKVHSTIGNLNNHIGVPLTLANMPIDTEFAVIEMGMNHADEISYLSSIALPDIAVITWIAENHIEYLGSLENIAKAKAEIYEWLKRSGSAIAPSDSDYFQLISEIIDSNGITNSFSFGRDCNNVFNNGAEYEFNIDEDEFSINVPISDELVLNNILCALTICKVAGVDISKTKKIIENFKPVKGRGEVLKLKNGAKIIDDSYNASPTSMVKALKNLTNQKSERKIAVLGNMLELGKNSQKYHEEISNYLTGINEVYTVGNFMKFLSKKLPKNLKNKHFDDYKSAYEFLNNYLKKSDLVLIKGSHGSNLWKLVEELKNSSY